MDHPCGQSRSPPYLVLLRAGFCLPPMLPPARCALTAPFHPYSPSRALASPLRRSKPCDGPAPPKPAKRAEAGGMFSVPLVLRVAPTGNYPAHCPLEFGLSSLRLRA